MNTQEILNELYGILVKKNPTFQTHSLKKVKDEPLNNFGLDSIGLLNFMVAIEDELGIEWDEEKTNTETLKSLTNMALYIENEFASAK